MRSDAEESPIRRVSRIAGPVILISVTALALSACGSSDDGSHASAAAIATPSPALAVADPSSTGLGAGATLPTPSPTAQDPTRFTVTVDVDASKRHSISPLIYGVARPSSGDGDTLAWLGATAVRWGGDSLERYNWEINATNTGSAGGYQNLTLGDSTPGSAALNFLRRNLQLGSASVIAVPAAGWVAKDGTSRSAGVPPHGGPPVQPGSDNAFTDFVYGAWERPYDPSANRAATSIQSLPSKGAPFAYPPDLKDGKVYQDEWIAYLRSQRPAGAPPTIYTVGNAPELWADGSQVDIHPVRPGYDDLFATFEAYARAVKSADSQALAAGPESWGVTGYLYSALDEGGDRFAKAADREAHGNLPFIQWFLKSAAHADSVQGYRTLDVLSVRYYPGAGESTAGSDAVTQVRRMQAPRALWDGLFIEQSWVARTEWANLALIRRLNKLISQYYPGTKLGLSEWNFGGENDISGAIATADSLGIFGREGLYYASLSDMPAKGSPTGWAFRLFRNYDGHGAAFGSESIDTLASDTDNSSAYGALNRDGTRLTLVLINRDSARTATFPLNVRGFTARTGQTYTYSRSNLGALVPAALDIPASGPPVVSLPPMSFCLVALNK